MSRYPNTVSLVNRALKPKTIGETHITVPGSADLFDSYRFHGRRTFVEKGSSVPSWFGEIHDAVAGPVAGVYTLRDDGQQVIGVMSTSKGGVWQRAYDPAQDIVEQISLIACVALNGYPEEFRS